MLRNVLARHLRGRIALMRARKLKALRLKKIGTVKILLRKRLYKLKSRAKYNHRARRLRRIRLFNRLQRSVHRKVRTYKRLRKMLLMKGFKGNKKRLQRLAKRLKKLFNKLKKRKNRLRYQIKKSKEKHLQQLKKSIRKAKRWARKRIRSIKRASKSKLKKMILFRLRTKEAIRLAKLRRKRFARLRKLFKRIRSKKLNRTLRRFRKRLNKAYRLQAKLRKFAHKRRIAYLNIMSNGNKRMKKIATSRRKDERKKIRKRLREGRKRIRQILRRRRHKHRLVLKRLKKRLRQRMKQIRKASILKLKKMHLKRLRSRYVSLRRRRLLRLRSILKKRALRKYRRIRKHKKRMARHRKRIATRRFIRRLRQTRRGYTSRIKYLNHVQRSCKKIRCPLQLSRRLRNDKLIAKRRFVVQQNNLKKEWLNEKTFIRKRLSLQMKATKKAYQARVAVINRAGFYRLRRFSMSHLLSRRAYQNWRRLSNLRLKVLKKLRRNAKRKEQELLRRAKRWQKKHRNIQYQIAKRNAQLMKKYSKNIVRKMLWYARQPRLRHMVKSLKMRYTRHQQQVLRMQHIHRMKINMLYRYFHDQIRKQLYSIRHQLRVLKRKIWMTTSRYRIRQFLYRRFRINNSLRNRLKWPRKKARQLNKSMRGKIKFLAKKARGKKRGNIQHADELAKADYYWNFNQQVDGQTIDMVHNQPAFLSDGAEIDTNSKGEKIASTSDSHGWISLGDFAGKCFSDPGLCRNHGLTVIARLKLDKDNLRSKPSTYILSTGGQTTKARGFALLRLAKKYILILSTKDRQWKLETADMPDGWFNLGVTWQNKKLLKLFIDGKEVASSEAIKVSRPVDSFTSFDIGRPNNSPSHKHRMPMNVHSIALWEEALSDHKITEIQKGTQDEQEN